MHRYGHSTRQQILTRLCLSGLVVFLSTRGAQSRQVKAAGGAGTHSLPKGYEYYGMVEFTDSPNHGRPHLHLATAQESVDHPPEAQHTILVTPDGRAFRKSVTETLEEFRPDVFQPNLQPEAQQQQQQQPESSRAASRQLAQTNQVASPSASIGVSTSSDLSCNGCGPDNRVQVTDTTTYPYMTVGRLIGQLGTSSLGLECTGTLIGNTHVLTAAHCVFDINASRKMVANLNFAPALSGSRAPYGTLQWTQARILSQFSSQPGYTTTAMNYDFALVTLAIPATSGYLSLYIPPSSIGSTKPTLATAGYPGSKPSGTMWSSACGNTTIDYSNNNAFANVAQCTGGKCSNILTHTCISSDGQSGSGMWDDGFNIRAVLTGKVTVSNGDAYNVATEIDTEVYNQIASWYNEDKDTAGNGTLPLAPSGPGSQPSTDNAFVRWWRENWGKNWFVAVVIIVCVVIAGILLIILVQLIRCCQRRGAQKAKLPQGTYTSRPSQPARPPQQATPAHPQGSYPPSGYPSSGYPPSGYPSSPFRDSFYRNNHF